MGIYQRMTIQGRGGALPTYQNRQAPYAPGSGVSARLSDAAGQIVGQGAQAEAQALGRLGEALHGAVKVGLSAYEDYSKTKATELVTRYKTRMRQNLYGEGGILTREGEAAFTANSDALSSSRQLREELLQDHGGSLVERLFNAMVDPQEAEFSLKAQEYEGRQYRAYQDRTDTAAFSEAAESALYGFADADTFNKGVGEALYFQEQLLRRKGFSGEALEHGLKESGSRIFAGGIDQALAQGDLASARRLLQQGEGSRMTAEDAARARKAITSRAEALQARAEANVRKAGRELLSGWDDALYAAKNMGDASGLDRIARSLRALGLTEEAEKAAEAAETWKGMEDVSRLSLPELAQKLSAMKGALATEGDVPAHRRLSTQVKALQDVYGARAKALQDDPAQAAASSMLSLPDNATMADTLTARMEWQVKNGVRPEDAAPLTRGEASALGRQYMQSGQPVQFLAEMRQTYGDQFRPTLKQLVTSGAVPLTANLIADMDPEAGGLLAQASRKDFTKEAEAALGMDDIDRKDMKGRIRTALEDCLGTLTAQGDSKATAGLLDASYLLALRYRETGMDAADAAEQAARKVFSERYAVKGSYRVPMVFEADSVEAGTAQALDSLDMADLDWTFSGDASHLAETAKQEAIRRTLKLSGRWVTNSDESGLILTLGGAPVRLKHGGPVTMSYEELEALGREPGLDDGEM